MDNQQEQVLDSSREQKQVFFFVCLVFYVSAFCSFSMHAKET